MKKIVGILGMAAVLGSMAFAAEPAANFVMSEFTGSAEFGLKGNFAPKDAQFGMFNNADAGIKFGFMTAGDKTTTGDGIWGELKIKAEANDPAGAITNPIAKSVAVDTAKIHFVDGDFSMAMNLLKPSLKYDGFTPASATPIVAKKNINPDKDAFATLRTTYTKAVETAKTNLTTAQTNFNKATADDIESLATELAKAKSALATAEANLKTLPAAPTASSIGLATAGIGKDDGLGAGFGLELKMDGLFAFNFKLMDKGLNVAAKDQKFGLAFDASLLAVDNLEASVALSMNFDKKYTGLQAKAAYNFAIDDTMYLKPAVTYEMNNTDGKSTNALAAGLLFGWGAKDSEQTLDFFGKYKYNEGVSVALCPLFAKDNTDFLMTVGFYDQSLFNLLGIEEYGALKSAFGFDSYIAKETYVNTIRAALAYDVTFSPVYISTHFGMEAAMAKGGDFKPALKFGVKLGSKEVIDNTDVYVSYEMEKAGDADKLKTNELVIGTKISF